MKATELRIGNTLLNNGKPFNVDNHDIGYIDRNPSNKLWSSIPLTEEWLLKFGIKPNRFLPDLGYICTDSKGYYLETDDGGSVTDYPLEYVHQLQNLYHAITGEELILKEQ